MVDLLLSFTNTVFKIRWFWLCIHFDCVYWFSFCSVCIFKFYPQLTPDTFVLRCVSTLAWQQSSAAGFSSYQWVYFYQLYVRQQIRKASIFVKCQSTIQQFSTEQTTQDGRSSTKTKKAPILRSLYDFSYSTVQIEQKAESTLIS